MDERKRWLPREGLNDYACRKFEVVVDYEIGFTFDVVSRIVRNTLLNPTLTLPFLLLARYTKKGQELTNDREGLIKHARILLYIGLIRVFNGYLNRRVINNSQTDKYNWNDEIVVVTGGSDGIGKHVVNMLAMKNVKIAVLDIQPLQYAAPPNVSYHRCDITSTKQITEMASEIRTMVGNPTILVNNAGVCRGKSILDTTDDDVQFTFDVNTLAHYKLVREFLPHMIQQNHGMIITVSSLSAYFTVPRLVDYGSSNAAALCFHEGLAAELATIHKAPKVRTVLVTPGFTKTGLFTGFGGRMKNKFFRPELYPQTVAEAIVKQILSGNSGHIILPESILVGNLRSLPEWLQAALRIRGVELMKE
ncbi:MAG: hypothetical protein M1834_008283 [Cirrosporium novae-zelandiae]|nr:MAG: hypothetical protein M1834_008283 [Cirrosporium novae-zelandiae]